MSDHSPSVGFDALMAALADYCGQRRSGTLFIVTSDNHSAKFVLENGELVACGYSLKQGHDALPLLRGIKECTFRFAADVFSSISELPMPPTDKCLHYLRGESARTVAGEKPHSMLTDDVARVLREELARLIGPVAGIVLERYVSQIGAPDSPTRLNSLIGALSGEVGGEAKAKAFSDSVTRRLCRVHV
jgi:hypothetical protein